MNNTVKACRAIGSDAADERTQAAIECAGDEPIMSWPAFFLTMAVACGGGLGFAYLWAHTVSGFWDGALAAVLGSVAVMALCVVRAPR